MSHRFTASLLAAGCLALAHTCLATAPVKPTPEASMRARLDRDVPGWLKQADVPSAAIAWIDHGAVAWTQVYGEQSPGVRANAQTLYNVASLTKPVSAEVVMRLVAQGKVSLDEPISAYWVDPDVKDNAWNTLLTPRICLSHQTGFKNWRYESAGKLQFQWQPGTQTGYSGEGYDYVARFVEKKTGKPFEALASELVFAPLGMTQTAYTPRDWFKGRLAVAHGPQGDITTREQTGWSAADLLRTTIGDYARLVVAVMHGNGLSADLASERLRLTRNLATREDLDKLCAKANVSAAHCNGSASLALGWQVLQLDGRTIVDHSGNDPGVRTLAFFDPQRQVGAVVFTNGEKGDEVIRKVVGVLYPAPLFLQTL